MRNALHLLAASPVALALAFVSTTADAAGVPAGTLIQNTASATYKSGAADLSVNSNTVDVRVDELLNVAVADLTGSAVTTGSSTAILSYSVTNTGNGPEAFNLTANPVVTGNNFNVTIDKVVYDANGNGVYDAGDTIIPTGGATPVLNPDQIAKILVYVTLPNSATDGQTSNVELLAAAVTGTGSPGTSFAGQGFGGGDAVVGLSGADDTAKALITAALASVTLTKTAVVSDIWGGTKSVPGSTITYTIAATVSGTGTASNLHVTDVIPTGTTYKTGTLKLDTTGLTDAVDTDAGKASSSGVDVALGDVAGGSSKSVQFSVTIN